MTARWEAALDAQLDFVASLAPGRYQRTYTERFLRSYYSEKERPSPDAAGIARMPYEFAVMAFNADTYFVDRDMGEVWRMAIPGFDAEPLHSEDLITPKGFLWLEEPYEMMDVHNKRMTVRAIVWHPQALVMRSDKGFESVRDHAAPTTPERDETRTKFPVKRVGNELRADGITLLLLHDSRDRDDYSVRAPEGLPAGLLVTDLSHWSYGTVFSGDVTTRMGDTVLAFQALWRLMSQTLAVITQERPDRATRRRLQRLGMPERLVSVTRLRRPEGTQEPGEPGSVNWTHRWLVGGHWRWQPYPSLGEGVRKQIWISPYVKGPADLPLVARKARIFELVR